MKTKAITNKILLSTALIMSCLTPRATAQSWLTTGNTGTSPSTNYVGTKDKKDFVFRTNALERGRILGSNGSWRFGSATNNLTIDATGKLTFAGTGVYQVGGNKYAFQYSGNPNYGLYFNATAVQYEFRNGLANPVFYVNANTGAGAFVGALTVGAYTLPATDGANNQVLKTNGNGVLSWSNDNNTTYTAGNGISITSNVIQNTAPDLLVSISGSNGITTSGTYPNFTISSNGLWKTTGNAGTTAANFIGTTDAQPLRFKVNNQNAGLIDYDNVKSNTAFGYQSLASNTTGSGNVANGYQVMYDNTSGKNNTSNGYQALYSNTDGNGNIADGNSALYSNTDGNYNTAIGTYALYSNTIGSDNTAIGNDALISNTSGYENVANGENALNLNTIGFDNTANGHNALLSSTTGNYNTANGNNALDSNTTGSYNAANGNDALYSNTTGNYNAANGNDALYSNTTGNYNAANGNGALYSNTTGLDNTANGSAALYSNTIGNYNTAIGDVAYFDSPNLDNTTCIGYYTGAISSASNRIEIGNSSVSWIGGEVGWSQYSDGRIKDNVREDVPGLAFIDKLRPVSYNLDIHKENEFIYKGKKEEGDWNEKYDIEKQRFTGFIAQDVEKAAKEANYEFSGLIKPTNSNDLYSLRYSDFVVPLVKAVQELSTSNNDKDATIDSLSSKVAALDSKTQALQSELDNLTTIVNALQQQMDRCDPCAQLEGKTKPSDNNMEGLSSIVLDQNIPNPFSNSTSIGYFIPAGLKNPELVVVDMSGQTIQQIPLQNGKGTVTIDAGSLSSGAYSYALLINGKVVASKKMILSR